jgi:hypothetical protein
METKICSKCGVEKELSKFNKEKTCKGGIRPDCHACSLLYSRQQYIRFKEKKQMKLKEFWLKYPWKRTLSYVTQRCNNPKASAYSSYGGKGIRCLLTEEDIKFLWFRDGANLMKQPSIHRLNSADNYCIENCQFLEWEAHVKLK